VLMSEKITLVFTAWTIAMLFLTGDENLEIFFVLIFIGVLIIRQLTDVFAPSNLKDRMSTFIYLFVIIFIVIVGKKIITILGM
jgi:hypothetical protein